MVAVPVNTHLAVSEETFRPVFAARFCSAPWRADKLPLRLMHGPRYSGPGRFSLPVFPHLSPHFARRTDPGSTCRLVSLRRANFVMAPPRTQRHP
jgi:hypothetical protein